MKFSAALLVNIVALASAYPNILAHLEERDAAAAASSSSLLKKRVPFDAASQLVDVHGKHKFVPPGPGDQRGPCPGLNALANHNYLPHNGIATIDQFITSTGKGKPTVITRPPGGGSKLTNAMDSFRDGR